MIKGMFVRFCRNQNIENNARNIRACGIMVSNLDIQFLFKDYPFGYMARLFRLFANVIKMLHSKKNTYGHHPFRIIHYFQGSARRLTSNP